MLGKLGRGGGRAPSARGDHRPIQRVRNIGVRLSSRQSQVARPVERIVDDLGQPAVNVVPFRAEILVEHRREQRVRKADRPAVALEHMRDEGSVECNCSDARPFEHGVGTRPERSDKCERSARRGRQPGDPCPEQLVERLRDGRRPRGIEL